MNSVLNATAYEYRDVKKVIKSLLEKYSFLTCKTIGKSCAGREIWMLQIGKASEYVLYTAAFHGSEHITAPISLLFAEQLCHALKNGLEICGIDARRALYGKGVLIVPLVNPDGCEISIKGAIGAGYMAGKIKRLCGGDFTHWNANLRGVDINHNFPAGWDELHRLEHESGIWGPSSTRFGGYIPASEPETQALMNLCEKENIRHVMALHTQGEVIYWSYGKNVPEHSKKMAEILAAESGYALDVPTGLALGGGFKDWFIDKFGKPGFTLEIGRGKNPLPPESMFSLYGDVAEMLMLTAVM